MTLANNRSTPLRPSLDGPMVDGTRPARHDALSSPHNTAVRGPDGLTNRPRVPSATEARGIDVDCS